ncbi:MAG: RagB/SusD family nutrient uptake outer membrane protein [Bacteroidales bacterium]
MKKNIKYSIFAILMVIPVLFMTSCEDFLDPEQELDITEDQLFDDWYEYRSIEMGMYGLQQNLVEQLVVLGELRADLLTITEHANADLVDIYNFNISRDNRYASPTNFFKLIAASNNFIKILKREHPEVLDKEAPVTNYDRLFGEALCMRAWTYFNAARIYGKVPYIPESLVTIDEIEQFVNSSGTYVDSVYIEYSVDGYYNDTTYNEPISLEKNYYNLDLVIDHFTNQLESQVKAVGVNHYIDNNDISWEVTIWNNYAMHALLGQMYLTQGDLLKAEDHFDRIMYNTTENLRYQLDNSFAYGNWRNIFDNIDTREHIFTLWFNKANFQQNELQRLFDPFPPHEYMLKPSGKAIFYWETVWRAQRMDRDDSNPSKTEMIFPGIPSDYFRGYGSSYMYFRGSEPLDPQDYMDMLMLKAREDERSSLAIMENVDTVVYKYSINKGLFDQDANFIVYRGAGIHLWMAELYTYYAHEENGIISPRPNKSLGIVNDGSNYSIVTGRDQLGVRGRVGLGSTDDRIYISDIIYEHDPYTNEVIGYKNLQGNLKAKQEIIEEEILKERARELAYEGERFYDLMRIAKRRNDPSFLASRVSEKYPEHMRDYIYNLLLDENNWYINFFE